MQFRKKPVIVEAHQWFKNGDHPADNSYLMGEGTAAEFLSEGAVVRRFRRPFSVGGAPCAHCERPMHDHGWIDTLEGGHIVCPGDWIITGVKGEMYPCKNDVFQQSYEEVPPC